MFTYEQAKEYAKIQENITGIPHYIFELKPSRCSKTGSIETLFEVGVVAK